LSCDENNSEKGGISPSVRERVMDEIKVFEEALSRATANPAPETLDRLYHAADRLMRATGGVIIEVERVRSGANPKINIAHRHGAAA
jgi:hypothetical protein